MKAILMSIRPQHACNIFNLIKLWEIRTQIPSDYVGWYYIYVTKGKPYLVDYRNVGGKFCITPTDDLSLLKEGKTQLLNGKVVARFWCDKVEEISYNYRGDFTSVYTDTLDTKDLEKQACLTKYEFAKYLQGNYGYAIHITKLEIFDKPKEISEFRKPSTLSLKQLREFGLPYTEEMYKDMATKGNWFITRAPQSYMFIEV